jgi:hypothetical protein
MATTLDLTEFDWALKDLYDDARVMEAMYTENVAFARVPKVTKFPGRKFIWTTKYRDLTGRSASFARALANRGPAKGVDWEIQRKHDYAIGRIETEVILASEDDEGAFLEATESEGDSAINALKRSIGISMFGNGSGKLGTVSSPGADPTLTLGNPDDITNFEEGMCLVVAADESTAPRNNAGTPYRGYVGDVDRDAGTFEVEDSAGSPANVTAQWTGISDGDCIFADGDYVSAADREKIYGFDAWNPPAATSVSTAFCGATRSVDRSRLAGVAYSSTTHPGLNTLEAIQLVASRIKRQGFKADTCYLGTDRFRGLINALESKAEYVKYTAQAMTSKGEVVAEVGFDAIRVRAGGAVVDCFEELNCPEDTIHVQRRDAFEFKSLGTVPRWLAAQRIVEDADEVEFRLAYWGNLRCKNTAAIGRYDWL